MQAIHGKGRSVTKKSLIEQYTEFRDEIWEKDPHYRGFMATLIELNKETDRGVALVTTSFLDKLMGDAIAAFLIDNSSAEKFGGIQCSARQFQHKDCRVPRMRTYHG
jgi:hypothetical protein